MVMTNVKIDSGPRAQGKPVELDADAPFRIAILGDFSGRANRKMTGPLRSIEIDPSNFEDVMQRLNVALDLPAGSLQFRELDDFHPDQLYQNLPLFEKIREAKKQASRPGAFRPAAAAFAPPAAPPSAGASLLDQIVEQSSPEPARASARPESGWEQAIRKIAARHAVPGRDPRQEEALALLDQTAAAEMRAILSHPDFQAIEAAWRSLFFFFRYVETGVELRVELIDVSRGELYDKLPELQRIFADAAPGEPKWSAIVGLFTFSPCGPDCELLARLGRLARMSGAPFLSSIDGRLFGCESIAAAPDPDDWTTPLEEEHRKAWARLRQSEDASWIGLAFPRFLLRLPYGKATSAIDSFDFEEMPEPAHDRYLWGNAAIACATLLGQEFNRQGWEMRARSMAQIDGLPLHTPPGRDATPPAEIWMTERLAGRIAEAGVMPLASMKHSDAILLVRFQSIADPAQPLSGPW
jgi:type VI secretion system protein ImpC